MKRYAQEFKEQIVRECQEVLRQWWVIGVEGKRH